MPKLRSASSQRCVAPPPPPRAEERHIELQYESAARERDAARLAVELEAATNAAEAAQDVAERRQRQAASLEAKHTRLSMELSAALQKLRETERDVLAEKRRLSLSFRTNHRHVGGVISASPLVLVGGAMDVVATPPDLASINGTPSSDSDASAGSPVLSRSRDACPRRGRNSPPRSPPPRLPSARTRTPRTKRRRW